MSSPANSLLLLTKHLGKSFINADYIKINFKLAPGLITALEISKPGRKFLNQKRMEKNDDSMWGEWEGREWEKNEQASTVCRGLIKMR